MTPTEMTFYLSGQIKILGDEMAVVNNTRDPEKIRAKCAAMKPQVEYLRGYATCLEHAGVLTKDVVDDIFRMFDVAAKL